MRHYLKNNHNKKGRKHDSSSTVFEIIKNKQGGLTSCIAFICCHASANKGSQQIYEMKVCLQLPISGPIVITVLATAFDYCLKTRDGASFHLHSKSKM
jgi:hypothetical protein